MLFTCQNINADKLLIELKSAGIFVNNIKSDLQIGELVAQKASFDVNDVDVDLVQTIVDAHDPTPIPSEPSELEILRDYVLEMEFRMILKELEV